MTAEVVERRIETPPGCTTARCTKTRYGYELSPRDEIPCFFCCFHVHGTSCCYLEVDGMRYPLDPPPGNPLCEREILPLPIPEVDD